MSREKYISDLIFPYLSKYILGISLGKSLFKFYNIIISTCNVIRINDQADEMLTDQTLNL